MQLGYISWAYWYLSSSSLRRAFPAEQGTPHLKRGPRFQSAGDWPFFNFGREEVRPVRGWPPAEA